MRDAPIGNRVTGERWLAAQLLTPGFLAIREERDRLQGAMAERERSIEAARQRVEDLERQLAEARQTAADGERPAGTPAVSAPPQVLRDQLRRRIVSSAG